ncbi:hypothetical protein ACYULU_16070 [Breznakiellaceae bacterium SP9]
MTATTKEKREKIGFSIWDPAEDIKTKEDALLSIEAALEDDPYSPRTTEHVFRVVGAIARSPLMRTRLSDLDLPKDTDVWNWVPPESTVYRVLEELGLAIDIN